MNDTLNIIGHRGGVDKKGENTLDIMKEGFSHGADMIECDLNMTKDGVICIYHDPHIKVNGNKKYIKDISFEELLSYKSDICSLEDLLKNLGDKFFVFELKDESDYKKIVDIFSSKYPEQFAKNRFISFSLDALKYVKLKNSEIYCIYIGTSLGDNKRIEPFISKKHIEICTENELEELAGHWATFRPGMIKEAKNNDIKIGLGPIDSEILLKHAKKHGINNIYTNNVLEMMKIR